MHMLILENLWGQQIQPNRTVFNSEFKTGQDLSVMIQISFIKKILSINLVSLAVIGENYYEKKI